MITLKTYLTHAQYLTSTDYPSQPRKPTLRSSSRSDFSLMTHINKTQFTRVKMYCQTLPDMTNYNKTFELCRKQLWLD